jgi:hypothetical protein
VGVRTTSPVSVGVDNQLSRGGAVKDQAEVNCAMDVAEEALQRSKMRYYKTPVCSRIIRKITKSSRKLCLSVVNRSGVRSAISHPSSLQNIKGILSLVKEETNLMRLNCHTQEVVKLAKILHSKLLPRRGDNPLKQLWTGGC